jgi:hypothetical protein
MSMTGTVPSTTTTLPTPAHSVNGSSLPSEMTQDLVMGEDSPHKRKRAIDDVGDREQKKVDVEGRKLGIDDLHLDVGEKYLLCRTRKTPLNLFKVAPTARAVFTAASLLASHKRPIALPLVARSASELQPLFRCFRTETC